MYLAGRILASLMLVALTATGAVGEPVSERINQARLSLKAGLERSAIYALSDARLPLEIRVEAGRLSFMRGFDPVGGGYVVYRGFSWSPVLAYDDDINGGSGKDGFSFGGFDFVIPEDQRRKGGAVAGAEADAFIRYALGGQTVLDLGADAYLAWSPEHEIGKISVGVSACATRQMERNFYVSGCALIGHFENDLSRDLTASARASVHQIFDLAGYVQDVQFSVSETHITDRVGDEAYGQARFEFSGHAVSASGHQFGYAAMIGERVDEQKVRTRALSVYAAAEVFGRGIVYGGEFSSYDGARWLGASIEEEDYSAFVQVPLHATTTARAEYIRTISGSQLTDGERVSFTVHVRL